MNVPTLLARPAVVDPREFFAALRVALGAGARLLSLFGRPAAETGHAVLTALLVDQNGLRLTRTQLAIEHGYHSLSRDLPQLNIFERELHEQLGIRPHDHPWLKPVRYPTEHARRMADHPFYKLAGKEVHEVGVGPIHAGVIEPGHFRFMCLGETVHHLEIQLGYQHRDVERALLAADPFSLTPLVETIAGDSSIAHAWAYCDAIEALAGVDLSPAAALHRGVALELERVAMHLAGLAGICGDIAFLQGASTYGRLRTTAINTSMRLCGSRFGRGWLRPGGVRTRLGGDAATPLRANLALLVRDLAIINDEVQNARSVTLRLADVGTVRTAQALELGLVGMTARASGVPIDLRASLAGSPYADRPLPMRTEPGGDCLARTRLRMRELEESLRWLTSACAELGPLPFSRAAATPLPTSSVAVAVREGWRGEVVHVLETDEHGKLLHYKVQDPSLRNWIGVALAMREQEISDFPVCNKSFDLSYCGNDL